MKWRGSGSTLRSWHSGVKNGRARVADFGRDSILTNLMSMRMLPDMMFSGRIHYLLMIKHLTAGRHVRFSGVGLCSQRLFRTKLIGGRMFAQGSLDPNDARDGNRHSRSQLVVAVGFHPSVFGWSCSWSHGTSSQDLIEHSPKRSNHHAHQIQIYAQIRM